MKKCDNLNNHIKNQPHMIYISLIMIDTLLLRPSLHCTFQHCTSSHLNFTQLHFTTLSFGLTHLNFLPLHFTSHHNTSLHFASLHCTFRRFLPHFYSFLFILCIAFLTLFLKILGLQGKVPDASAGSWF